MKRFIIFLTTLCLILMSGCSGFVYTRISKMLLPQAESKPAAVLSAPGSESSETADTEASSSSESKPVNYDEIDYYKPLRDDVSSESYQTLLKIYYTYGIEIHFSDDAAYDGVVTKRLEAKDYDHTIEMLDSALTALGNHPNTIKIINNYIDYILCYDSFTKNKANSAYLYDDDQKAMVFSVNYDSDTLQLLPAIIMSSIGNGIANVYDLDSYGFTDYHYNGFVDYSKFLDDSEDDYLTFLNNNNVVSHDDIKIELWRAGFFNTVSLKSPVEDFSAYVRELVLPDSTLWGLYPSMEPMHSKTDCVLDLLNDINPAWTPFYFLSLSQPENEATVFETYALPYSLSALLYGEYEGTYQNNSGEMTCVLDIVSVDSDLGMIDAIFSFAPAPGNTKGKSGEFKMEGGINFNTAAFSLTGTEWISEQPANYDLLSFKGNMFSTVINATIDHDDDARLVLHRVSDNE